MRGGPGWERRFKQETGRHSNGETQRRNRADGQTERDRQTEGRKERIQTCEADTLA